MILLVRLRPNAKPGRILELIHRAIPYPVLLIAEQSAGVGLSLAHKRWSEAEHGETVAEELHQTVFPIEVSAVSESFLKSMDLAVLLGLGRGAADMRTVYQGWIDRVTAFNAIRIAGTYTVPDTPEDGIALRNALQKYAALDREITGLRAQAQKEVQVNRQVELNLAVKRIEAEMAGVKVSLRKKDDEAD